MVAATIPGQSWRVGIDSFVSMRNATKKRSRLSARESAMPAMVNSTPPKPPATSPAATVEITCRVPSRARSPSPCSREARKFGRLR